MNAVHTVRVSLLLTALALAVVSARPTQAAVNPVVGRLLGETSRESTLNGLGNPFMFQGRPHFAIDTAADATEGELMLNDHRARMNDPVTGRWITRDPLYYNPLELPSPPNPFRASPEDARRTNRIRSLGRGSVSTRLFGYLDGNPLAWKDPTGLKLYKCCDQPCGCYGIICWCWGCTGTAPDGTECKCSEALLCWPNRPFKTVGTYPCWLSDDGTV